LKDYEFKNYFVPVQIGAPDKRIKPFYVTSIKSIANYSLFPPLLILVTLLPLYGWKFLNSSVTPRNPTGSAYGIVSRLKREKIKSNALLKIKPHPPFIPYLRSSDTLSLLLVLRSGFSLLLALQSPMYSELMQALWIRRSGALLPPALPLVQRIATHIQASPTIPYGCEAGVAALPLLALAGECGAQQLLCTRTDSQERSNCYPLLTLHTLTRHTLTRPGVSGEGVERSSPSNSSHSKLKIGKLGPYLAGLWEGDGHISNLKQTENDQLRPYLAITFPIKDLPLVTYLQEYLGGSIRHKYKDNALVLTIAARKDLIKVVLLMNGYLRTPKIFEFNKLIEWLNKGSSSIKEGLERQQKGVSLFIPTAGGLASYGCEAAAITLEARSAMLACAEEIEIKQHSEDKSDIGTNGWFSGFFDADGSFKVRYTEKAPLLRSSPLVLGCSATDSKRLTRKGRIEVRIAIEQRQYHSKTEMPFEPIMKSISEYLSVKLKTSRHNVDKEYWNIEVTSLSKLEKFVSYLNKYPLLTSKKNDYKDWLIVYSLISLNEHLTKEGKLKIKEIKNKMNRKRTKFDWSHLK
jgi:hypothetical protein